MPNPSYFASACCTASADLTQEVLLQHAASLEVPAEKPHSTEVTDGPTATDEIQSGSSPTDRVLSVDLDLQVALLTFTRPNGESAVLAFATRPFFFRVSHTHPYIVTATAAGSNSAVQPGWVLTLSS